MPQARVVLDPAFTVGPVRQRTFGAFVEHLGRCVYTGIYQPGHAAADEDGFRGDVLELVKELGATTIRYPGGNFVSAYRWEDGIGPKQDRPRRLDVAWHSTEPNTFGLDEFMTWCRKAGVEPMMAVNLGTRGVLEAMDIVEYCNIPGGTKLSDQRRANGAEEPHQVKLWCLGNEMDGTWQIGHKTAHEYGRLAAETARAMRQISPDLELVACGSSASRMPTFASWEYEVLSQTYDLVDYISAHEYYWENDGDLQSFLASPVRMNDYIKAVAATADAVRAAGKHHKRINISFDEWNVWHHPVEPSNHDGWPVAPRLLEDQYTMADAVVVGGLLITLLANTDRVHCASLAQLVNVIAPIMTDPDGGAWRQTTFHPFSLTARNARGTVLRPAISSPTVATNDFGEVAALDLAATHDAATGEIALFAVNRSVEDDLPMTVDLSRFGDLRITEALTYTHDDPYWIPTATTAETVLPAPNPSATIVGGELSATLPRVSWSMFKLTAA